MTLPTREQLRKLNSYPCVDEVKRTGGTTPRRLGRRSDMIDLEKAKAIVREVSPNNHPEFACMLVASAIAGSMGLTLRNIRVGALFWPDKFRDDPHLSMRGGWGCEGYSEREGRLFLADADVDEEGGFSGHTWIEPTPGHVVDLMHDNPRSPREIRKDVFDVVARYIPRPPLERAVKAFWRPQMAQAIKLGKARAKLCQT